MKPPKTSKSLAQKPKILKKINDFIQGGMSLSEMNCIFCNVVLYLVRYKITLPSESINFTNICKYRLKCGKPRVLNNLRVRA